MNRFAVDISVQIGEYDAPLLPINTFTFQEEDAGSFEIKDVYWRVLDFISSSPNYKDLKIESVECGFCISGHAIDEDGNVLIRRFYLSNLRAI